MEQGFERPHSTSRSATVRQWGALFANALERNDPSLEQRLSQLGGLPRSESAELADSIARLCRASVDHESFETARRMQIYGARAVARFGLSFSDEILNGDIAPSLLRVVLEPGDSCRFPKGAVQLAAIQALGQVAPRLSDDFNERICEAVLSYAMSRSDMNGFAEVVALAKFESLFRHAPFGVRRVGCAEIFRLNLRVIERMLHVTTESLAGACTEEECRDAIDTMVLARLAGTAWLTLLPSVAVSDDPEAHLVMGNIMEHAEWIVNRPYGYPGFFYGEGSIREFEAVRSSLSLSLGIASLADPRYERMVFDLALNPTWLANVPESVGNTLLRSVITGDVVSVRERYEQSIPLYLDSIGRAGLRAEGQDSAEATALAWHLGSVEPIVLADTLEHVYDPTAQYYLTKAICHPSPWGESSH